MAPPRTRHLVRLLLCGIASFLYWRFTESRGEGDLRFYGLVQYYPMVAIPLMISLFPPRYTHSWDLAGIPGCYLLGCWSCWFGASPLLRPHPSWMRARKSAELRE